MRTPVFTVPPGISHPRLQSLAEAATDPHTKMRKRQAAPPPRALSDLPPPPSPNGSRRLSLVEDPSTPTTGRLAAVASLFRSTHKAGTS